MILFALFSLFGCAVAEITVESINELNNAVVSLQTAVIFLLLLVCAYMIIRLGDLVAYIIKWRSEKKEALKEKQRLVKKRKGETKVPLSASKSKSTKKAKKDKKKRTSSQKKNKKPAAVSKESKSAKSSVVKSALGKPSKQTPANPSAAKPSFTKNSKDISSKSSFAKPPTANDYKEISAKAAKNHIAELSKHDDSWKDRHQPSSSRKSAAIPDVMMA